MTPTLLATFTGRDRPGLTAALFAALAPHAVAVLDVEQIVVRDRLTLGVLLAGVETEAQQALEAAAARLDLTVALSVDAADEPAPTARQHVVILGQPLTPAQLATVAETVASAGGNIDRIVRLSRYPVTSFELFVSGTEPGALRTALTRCAAALRIDVAVEAAGLARRSKRLVVMDVDSTLVQGEVIELLAAEAGCLAEVAAVTEQAMRGELDFEQSLRSRVALLAGTDAGALDRVRAGLRLTPGARTLVRTLKRLGYVVAIVSGGFSQVTDPLAAELGLDHALANTLEVVDGRLTGGLVGPVVDRAGKARALERFAALAGVPLAQTVAIGDGANDLDMLSLAGLGIAFNAKPVVREAADAAVTVPYLDAVLFLLGIPREEIEAADAGTPVPQVTPAPSDTTQEDIAT